jgi:hypothetical protein
MTNSRTTHTILYLKEQKLHQQYRGVRTTSSLFPNLSSTTSTSAVGHACSYTEHEPEPYEQHSMDKKAIHHGEESSSKLGREATSSRAPRERRRRRQESKPEQQGLAHLLSLLVAAEEERTTEGQESKATSDKQS